VPVRAPVLPVARVLDDADPTRAAHVGRWYLSGNRRGGAGPRCREPIRVTSP
jgi:hypothetical protein